MDESLQNIILSLFAFLSSVAAAARLNALLAALSERSYRVSQLNLESIVDDSNSRLQRISRSLKASRRNQRPRRFWERPGRTSAWRDKFQQNEVVPEEWKENFRMLKRSFLELCSELRPFIEKQATKMRKPISVETQVAVTLYYLSDEGRY